MIEYKYPEEKSLLLDYAARLGRTHVESILARDTIESEADARALATFFWQMVDASLNDDMAIWHERIHNTLYGALTKAGYGDIWDKAIPDA